MGVMWGIGVVARVGEEDGVVHEEDGEDFKTD